MRNKTESNFRPGFRLSAFDGVVIAMSSIVSIAIGSTTPGLAFVIIFVVSHFFLFCNVFRIARSLELVWSSIFVALAYCTITFSSPSWPITTLALLLVTIVVVAIEIRKPSYHGIFWTRINPDLPQWWAKQEHQLPSD